MGLHTSSPRDMGEFSAMVRWGADLHLDSRQRGLVNEMGFLEALLVYVPHGCGGGGAYFCTCAQCL